MLTTEHMLKRNGRRYQIFDNNYFTYLIVFFSILHQMSEVGSSSALNEARLLGLNQPSRDLKTGGEYEGLEFWQENDDLFSQAWSELPKLHPELYKYNSQFQEKFINPQLKDAVEKLRLSFNESTLDNETGNESEVHALLKRSEVVHDVFYFKQEFGLFTKEFCNQLLEELDYLSHSGVPMRRPNGMNRYGAILDQIGFKPVFEGIVKDYIRPLGEMIFPEHISSNDAAESYSFIVDYQKELDESSTEFDVDLKEHRDSSVATLNVCLGYDNFTGGNIAFREDEIGVIGQNSKGTGEVSMKPGLALIHKGQHRHAALPLESGRRVNLIIWLMGEDGYVRVAPHPVHDQLAARDRWQKR